MALSFSPDIDSDYAIEAATLVNRRGCKQLLEQSHAAIDTVAAAIDRARRPCTGVSPSALRPAVDRVCLDGPGIGFSQALAELGPLYLDPAIYFHHPRYVAHLNCPVLTSAAAAEMVAAAINTSMDTWDQSAGATLIEQKVIAWTAERAHLPAGADGIFTSGGTQSNLMALLLAREHYSARHYGPGFVSLNGLPPEASRWRIFASEMSHFSSVKAASLLGLGQKAVVPVAVDSAWRMDIDALETAMDNARGIFVDIEYCTDAYEVADDADMLVVATEWNQFRNLDLEKVRKSMRKPIVVDLRNIYDPKKMRALGFTYDCIGRPGPGGDSETGAE